MTRPNFSVALPGSWSYSAYGGATNSGNVSDNKSSAETVSGVSRRKPKGFIPPTAYSLLVNKYNRANGTSFVQVTPTNWSLYSGCVGSSRFNSLNHFNGLCTDFTADQTSSSLYNAALIAARLKIKNTQVNLGVAFAERKATSMMLGDTARRLATSVRQLRRGEFRNAARTLGIRSNPGKPRGSNWTNHWLQLQYGWKPLLSDVYGSCDALSKRSRDDWRVTAKALRRDTDAWYVDVAPKGASYPTGNYDMWKGSAVRQRGVFVRIDAIPENDLTMSLASLGVTNPLLVAWELVPYSFVVDWAFPIGNWLDSCDALLGYGPAWTSVSYYNKTLWEDTGKSHTWPSGKAFIKGNWLGTKERLKVTRSASSGVPLAAFPRIKDPRSLGHMANGLSLLAQAFAR